MQATEISKTPWHIIDYKEASADDQFTIVSDDYTTDYSGEMVTGNFVATTHNTLRDAILIEKSPETLWFLEEIISTYDAYRARGVCPAPTEYADVVKAIDKARIFTEKIKKLMKLED